MAADLYGDAIKDFTACRVPSRWRPFVLFRVSAFNHRANKRRITAPLAVSLLAPAALLNLSLAHVYENIFKYLTDLQRSVTAASAPASLSHVSLENNGRRDDATTTTKVSGLRVNKFFPPNNEKQQQLLRNLNPNKDNSVSRKTKNAKSCLEKDFL